MVTNLLCYKLKRIGSILKGLTQEGVERFVKAFRDTSKIAHHKSGYKKEAPFWAFATCCLLEKVFIFKSLSLFL